MGEAGHQLPTARRRRAGDEGASALGHSLAHSGQAVAAAGALQARDAGGSGAVDHPDLDSVVAAADRDLYGRAGSMFHGVGDALLHNAVGGVGTALGEVVDVATQLARDGHTRGLGPRDQFLDDAQPGGRMGRARCR